MGGKNSVYIATSLDGYIADQNGGLDFLDSIPIPEGTDMGYDSFMADIDALVMGRNTFEKVLSFDVPWPYKKPVFVLSHHYTKIPSSHTEKAYLIKGEPKEILEIIHRRGFNRLYIDGAKTIQGFLREDLIDEMIITVFPILLGDGIPLFNTLEKPISFHLKDSRIFAKQIIQSHFIRKNEYETFRYRI